MKTAYLLTADEAPVRTLVIPPVAWPGIVVWNGRFFVLEADHVGWKDEDPEVTTAEYFEVPAVALVDRDPSVDGGEARVVPVLQKTSPEIAQLCAKGLATGGDLTPDEVMSVCGSGLAQVE